MHMSPIKAITRKRRGGSPAKSSRNSRRKASKPGVLGVKRILAPTDFSRVSLQAVTYAERVARALGGEVVLLYVADESYLPDGGLYSSPVVDRVLEQGCTAARHDLAALRTTLSTGGIRVHTAIRKGPAADRIIELAEEQGIDWIVMGTHGRSDDARAVIGSVTERVIRTPPCPVLVVPRPDVHEA
jgi:universal stress protein A